MSGRPLARRNSLLKCVTWCSFLFFSISIPAIASDANGTVRFKSCAPFEFYRLDLARFQERRLEKPIAVALPIDGVLAQMNDWTAVPGIECAECETLVNTKIQILHLSSKWGRPRTISGNFAVELQGGRKLSGSFSANFIKPSTRIICE